MIVETALLEPFFLVGAERSGTTLLRLMLAHHSSIECAPEFEFLVEQVPDGEGWPDLGAYHEWLATNRIFLPHRLAIDRSLDYPALAKSFLAQYVERSGKPIRGATCHKHFDRLLRIWPEARFIHLVRDGRDVARSSVGMGWAGNVWHGVERWIAAETLWREVCARVPEWRRFELRYEDLIRAPECELEHLCAFLGTEYEAAMLEYASDSSYERPDPKLVGQWRRKLSSGELALLEARIGPLLRERGYEESGVAPARVGPLRRTGLWLHHRWRRFLFRRARYGLALLLSSRLAELSGVRAWKRGAILGR
jgi:hypothetical protein